MEALTFLRAGCTCAQKLYLGGRDVGAGYSYLSAWMGLSAAARMAG